jgi:hypothetical protein
MVAERPVILAGLLPTRAPSSHPQSESWLDACLQQRQSCSAPGGVRVLEHVSVIAFVKQLRVGELRGHRQEHL